MAEKKGKWGGKRPGAGSKKGVKKSKIARKPDSLKGVKCNFYIPKFIHDAMQAYCDENGYMKSSYISVLIQNDLDAKPPAGLD